VKRILFFLLAALLVGCESNPTDPENGTEDPTSPTSPTSPTPRLALWLAKKPELMAHDQAPYELVMSGWFEPTEAQDIRAATPSAQLLAGLTHTWVLDDPGWQGLMLSVANGGDPNGPLQITDDMFLKFDDDADGLLDRHCSLPGWDDILAMDPRHPGWRTLVLSFYQTVGQQTHHDGAVVDMVDAYPFCDGAWSEGVPVPLEGSAWVAAQDTLLGLVRDAIPGQKLLFVNAGRDFPAGSPFPRHVNGYLLENFLGSWGLGLEEGLASATRAIQTTMPPHAVVFSVDTDDTGVIDWPRFRTGLAASLLMDHTYYAFDFGPRDHGGVTDWWVPQYYDLALGNPSGAYTVVSGVYRRSFQSGLVVIAEDQPASVTFDTPHTDTATGTQGTQFEVPAGDARIYLKSN
jgi:hypothetical protein